MIIQKVLKINYNCTRIYRVLRIPVELFYQFINFVRYFVRLSYPLLGQRKVFSVSSIY